MKMMIQPGQIMTKSEYDRELKRWNEALLRQESMKLYGAVWTMEHMAEQSGLTDDLMNVLGDDRRAYELMFLGMYPLLSRGGYSEIEYWVRTNHTEYYLPSISIDDEERAEGLAEAISEDQLLSLASIRMKRAEENRRLEEERQGFIYTLDTKGLFNGPERYAAVVSYVCDADGNGYCFWNEHTDVMEIVVRSLKTGEPVFVRSFQEKDLDYRMLREFRADVEKLELGPLIFTGALSIKAMAVLAMCDIPFFADINVSRTVIEDAVLEHVKLDSFGMPEMEYDGKKNVFYGEYEMGPTVWRQESDDEDEDDDPWMMENACLMVELDVGRRAREIAELRKTVPEDVWRSPEEKEKAYRRCGCSAWVRRRIVLSREEQKWLYSMVQKQRAYNAETGYPWDVERISSGYRRRRYGSDMMSLCGRIAHWQLWYKWRTTELFAGYDDEIDMLMAMQSIWHYDDLYFGRDNSVFEPEQADISWRLGMRPPMECLTAQDQARYDWESIRDEAEDADE